MTLLLQGLLRGTERVGSNGQRTALYEGFSLRDEESLPLPSWKAESRGRADGRQESVVRPRGMKQTGAGGPPLLAALPSCPLKGFRAPESPHMPY